jgi:hypothetical protein
LTHAYSGDQDDPPGPIDLSAIRRTAELIDSVAERRFARSTGPIGPTGSPASTGPAGTAAPAGAAGEAGEPDDPAIRLLQALVTDVDQGAPPLCPAVPGRTRTGATRRTRDGRPRRARRRRGAHTLIALSVTAAMFTTTGVAAAGGMIARTERKESKPHSGLITGQVRGEARGPAPEAVGHAEGYLAGGPDEADAEKREKTPAPGDRKPGATVDGPRQEAPGGDSSPPSPTPTPTPTPSPTPRPESPDSRPGEQG